MLTCQPWICGMNWTKNKEDKIKCSHRVFYLENMKLWVFVSVSNDDLFSCTWPPLYPPKTLFNNTTIWLVRRQPIRIAEPAQGKPLSYKLSRQPRAQSRRQPPVGKRTSVLSREEFQEAFHFFLVWIFISQHLHLLTKCTRKVRFSVHSCWPRKFLWVN